ncbi:MAG: hypothetical protein L3J36_12300 [Rhodobacteraceae bacterium]|nr:hypothetical protein [Paracoccaceae bacterium]
MSGQLIGQLVSWLILAVVVIAIFYWVLNWLYRRTTKETAFVRTGFLGEKVVIDAGAFVWPIIHNVTPVNMNTLQLEVVRASENALITKDRMRVDVMADFYVRVRKTEEAVSIAASTLGQRTMKQEQLHSLLQGKFVSALREVAASMDLEEIHEQRSAYVNRVKESAHTALAENGLELETVAITDIDQTGLEYFNPSNRFDAEGLTKLIEEIEARRKTRNDIEQETSIQIRNRNLETEKRSLEIDLESEMARLNQERDIENRRAEQRAQIAQERAQKDAETKTAEIAAAEEIACSQIAQEQTLSKTRIQSELDVRKLELQRQKEVEEAEIATAKALEAARIDQQQALETQRIEADRVTREARIQSDEQVESAELKTRLELEKQKLGTDLALESERIESDRAREVLDISREQAIEAARLERRKSLEQLEVDRQRLLREAEIVAREEVERARIASERGLDEARITQERDRRAQEIARDQSVETAELDKAIAVYQKSLEEAAAQIAADKAQADVVVAEEGVRTMRATEEANRRRLVELTLAEKDAEARTIKAKSDQITAAVTAEAQRLINEAENILTDEARQSLFRRKMLEHVEGIVSASVKPLEKINEIKIMHLGGLGGDGGGSSKSATDEVIDSALRYRVQAPMIDSLLSEIGIEGGSLAKMGGLVREARDLNTLSKSAESDKAGSDKAEAPGAPSKDK